MKVQRLTSAVIVLGGLLLAADAFAGGVAGVRCVSPAPLEDGTARRNMTINAIVTFENSDTGTDLIVTRGALGQHIGNVHVVGPIAFAVPNVVVPRGIVVPPPAGCPGCPSSTQDGEASLTVPVKIPTAARPGTFVSIGLGFFGRKSGEAVQTRRDLGGDGCILEIVP